MHVYRLEFAENHRYGPFNPPQPNDPLALFFGMHTTVAPAEAAQVVATLEGKPGPFSLPGPNRDNLAEADESYVYGFASIAQYHEWFSTKAQREILFKRVTLNSREAVHHLGAPSGLELRCFDVPDAKVLRGEHQVAFHLEDAVKSKALSRKEAVQ